MRMLIKYEQPTTIDKYHDFERHREQYLIPSIHPETLQHNFKINTEDER